MSYSVDDRLPEDYFQSVIEEKVEIITKYLRNIGDPLVFSTHIGHIMATFNFTHTKRRIPSSYISPSPT